VESGDINESKDTVNKIYIASNYGSIGGDVTGKEPPRPIRSPWASGSFYLVAVVVMFALLGVIGSLLPIWVLPLIIVGGLLAVSIIGALQLRQDERLSDESFLKLMALALERLPLVRKLMRTDPNTRR
jgi:hypothetical protein